MVSFLANETLDMSPLVDLKRKAFNITKTINSFKIIKIIRHANVVAYEIARFSFDNRSEGVLYNSVPPSVANAAMNDCKNFLIN